MITRKLKLNQILVATALVLGAPLAAQAQDASIYQGGETAYTNFPVIETGKSRAEVKADVLEARADGTLDAMQQAQTPPNTLIEGDLKSRREVVQERINEPADLREAREELMFGA